MLSNALETLIILHGFFKPETVDAFASKKDRIFVLEGRPHLESAQRTVDELSNISIKPTLIADNMAGFLFSKNLVKEVHLTYQEKNSDGIITLIGGLILAVMAHKHQVPVYAYPAERKVNLIDDEKSLLMFNQEPVAYQKVQGYVPLVELVGNKYLTKINS